MSLLRLNVSISRNLCGEGILTRSIWIRIKGVVRRRKKEESGLY